MTALDSFLTGLSTFLQKVIHFFFGSGFGILLIIIFIIIYFVLKGMAVKEEKKCNHDFRAIMQKTDKQGSSHFIARCIYCGKQQPSYEEIVSPNNY